MALSSIALLGKAMARQRKAGQCVGMEKCCVLHCMGGKNMLTTIIISTLTLVAGLGIGWALGFEHCARQLDDWDCDWDGWETWEKGKWTEVKKDDNNA